MSDHFLQYPDEIEIHEYVDISNMNTLGVTSVARYLIKIAEKKDLQKLFNSKRISESGIFILGDGSNVLFADFVELLLLKIEIKGFKILEETEDQVLIRSGGGENWHNFVSWCVKNNFGGTENLALIPGTTGAAPVQNIGAYGVELEEIFDHLEAFDLEKGEFRTFHKDECDFAYRESIFKRELKNKFVITHLALRLTKRKHRIVTGYYSLKNYLEQNNITKPGISDIFNAVVKIRESKLPNPADIGNAGSFFKNPVLTLQEFEKLYDRNPDMPFFDAGKNKVKVPAGWLIEKTGWKGKQIGNVGTYENQALVIVNHGNASGKEIYDFAMKIRTSVKNQFGIKLVPEVNIVGNFDAS